MKIGCRITYTRDQDNPRFVQDLEQKFRFFVDLGICSCQLNVWQQSLMTKESADYVLDCAHNAGMEISALWAGWSGPCEWNFTVGPQVLGLVPPAYRHMRLEELKTGSRFAGMLGLTDMITHVGFLPENPNDPDFTGTIGALRDLCRMMKERGQYFLFETGQETPVTLLRAIEAIGTGNVGVNLDTGNLVCYGTGNPVDALDVIGPYVRNTHIKDSLYPVSGNVLGTETRPGEGKVDFPRLLAKLQELGYTGPLTIEREIYGEQQLRDIVHTRDMLAEIKRQLGIQ